MVCLSHADALSVAQVNAAVLAVFFAVVGIYLGVVFGAIKQMT
jgi:hypothetical protein